MPRRGDNYGTSESFLALQRPRRPHAMEQLGRDPATTASTSCTAERHRSSAHRGDEQKRALQGSALPARRRTVRRPSTSSDDTLRHASYSDGRALCSYVCAQIQRGVAPAWTKRAVHMSKPGCAKCTELHGMRCCFSGSAASTDVDDCNIWCRSSRHTHKSDTQGQKESFVAMPTSRSKAVQV
jgi:hypothetical protein